MTDRLVLRQWRDDDLDAWAAINADPSVREFLGGIQSREQAAGALARFRADIESRGWGWWALEEKATGTLIGMPPGAQASVLYRILPTPR